jgi:tetratricopeptide (TPR) repeat protein
MIATVFLAIPNRVHAQDNVAAAKKAYSRGDRAFRAGNYMDALAAFEEGYKLSGKALFLLNIAHSKHLMKDAPGALQSYREFLETNPEAEDRATAEKAIEELSAELPPEPVAAPEPPPPVPEPTGPLASPVSVSLTEAPAKAEASPGITSRWYFWAGVAAVVAAGVVVGVLVSGDEDPSFQMTGNWGAVRL